MWFGSVAEERTGCIQIEEVVGNERVDFSQGLPGTQPVDESPMDLNGSFGSGGRAFHVGGGSQVHARDGIGKAVRSMAIPELECKSGTAWGLSRLCGVFVPISASGGFGRHVAATESISAFKSRGGEPTARLPA